MKFQPHATGTSHLWPSLLMCEQLLDNIESKMKGTVVEVRFSSTLCHTRALVYLYLNLLLLQGTIAGLFEGKMEVGSSCMHLWLMWLPELFCVASHGWRCASRLFSLVVHQMYSCEVWIYEVGVLGKGCMIPCVHKGICVYADWVSGGECRKV